MILISAGHHQLKKGASFGDFNEHDEAQEWVSLIANYMGRDAMVVPSGILQDKVKFINSTPATVAIEIHFNSALDREGKHVGRGCETLYHPGSKTGSHIASWLQNIMAQYLPPSRGIKEGWYRMNPANGPDFFLARTNIPAIILEPEFIHHVDLIKGQRAAVCRMLADALIEIDKDLK